MQIFHQMSIHNTGSYCYEGYIAAVPWVTDTAPGVVAQTDLINRPVTR